MAEGPLAGEPAPGILARIIGQSATRPVLTLLVVAALALVGWKSMLAVPLDAIPDLSDTQVIVLTEWPGRGPDLVEDQLTFPISTALLAAPQVKFVRGQSFFGLSFVYVIFEDGTDMYWARTRVLEYMEQARARLPEGVTPTLGPDATGVGWVFQYALVDRAGGLDLQQLRSLQDWNVRLALESVPGVAEVASVGGFVKEYQVLVDPVRLRGYDLSIGDVARAVRESNEDVGGRTLEIAGHEHVLRGRGYLRDPSDLASVPLRSNEAGVPVTVGDVAEVTIGPAARRGLAELDGEGEVVGGIVVMRYGEDALEVIERVKDRLDEVRAGLPDGVELVVTYDRSRLILEAIGTLRHTLIEEMVVVAIIIFLFLLHARSALVAILTLPIGVLLAFIPMSAQGLDANIMSLGGIAVAIGAMVDASIVGVENVHRRLEEWQERGSSGDRRAVVIHALQEVGPSLFFSLLVITVSFLPVFSLQGTEGRLFKPLAWTKTWSMGFSAVLAVTATPALAALLIRGRIHPEDRHPLNRLLVRLYEPVVRFVLRWPAPVLLLAVGAMAATVPVVGRLGSEFMPPLNEGVILYMPTSPPGMGATEAAQVLQATDRALRAFPEVESVFGKMGRARTATDPAPIGMVETTIQLTPRSEWREGLTWDGLVAEMDAALRVPGMPNIWWMPIQTRTQMLATGVRSPVAVQIFGDDLASIERSALRIEAVLADLPGTRSAFAERSTGGFYIDVDVDRDAASREGLRVRQVLEAVELALGGKVVTETVEGRERYGVLVRYAAEWRDSPELLADVMIRGPGGAQVPLGSVATLEHTTGPPMIRSEDGRLVGFVFVDVAGRSLGDYVRDAKRLVGEQVALPDGTRLAWVGQYQNMERANARLKQVVPVTLLLVVLLLYLNTGSAAETAIVLLAVPFSLIGAFWLLYLLDYNLSVAEWVGIIALAGLDAETGVVMLLYLKIAWAKREREGRLESAADRREAVVEGAARRIRPKLMTVLTTGIGLVPILWGTGAGADVMKRIAAPMVGGLASSFLLELTVYPVLFLIWQGLRRRLPGEVLP